MSKTLADKVTGWFRSSPPANPNAVTFPNMLFKGDKLILSFELTTRAEKDYAFKDRADMMRQMTPDVIEYLQTKYLSKEKEA